MARTRRLLVALALAGAGIAAWCTFTRHDASTRLLRPLTYRHAAMPPRPAAEPWPPRAEALGGLAADEKEMMAGIEHMLRTALVANPGDVGAVLDAARRLLWFGSWPQAEALVDAVLATQPEDLEALAVRSAVLHTKGRREEAAELATRVLRDDPDQSLAQVVQAEQFAARGELERALARLRHAAAVDPQEPAVSFCAGVLLVAAGRYQDAAPWLAAAMAWVPNRGVGKGPFVAAGLATVQLLAGKEALRIRGPGSSELPMRRLPLPAVRATLRGNGRELTGWLVLDCGSSQTVLGNEAAGLARPCGDAGRMATVAGAQAVGFGLLERLELGAFSVDDVPVLVPASRHVPHAEGVIATLGVQVMRRFLTTFDLTTDTLHLARDGARRTAAAEVTIPFQLVDNQILVPARFAGGKPRTFQFDSGASAVFVATEVLGEEFGAVAGSTRTQVAFDGQESPSIEVVPPRPLEFGGRTLPLRSVFGDPTMAERNRLARRQVAGTIGLVVKARYGLDFARHELRMSR